MRDPGFLIRLILLQILVWSQRLPRILLRAAWVLLGLWLVFLTISFPFSISDTKLAFNILLFVLLLFSLFGLFIPWHTISRRTWELDRRFEHEEQLSTAWEVAWHKMTGVLDGDLLRDARKIIQRVLLHTLVKGWFIGRELLSILAILLLFAVYITVTNLPDAMKAPDVEQLAVLPLSKEPSYEDIFPAGIPGLTEELDATEAEKQFQLSPSQVDAMMETLQNLGEALQERSGTYQAGAALEGGDLRKAGEEFERLSTELNDLSSETKDALAESLMQAATELNHQRIEPLAQDMYRTAQEFSDDILDEMSEYMDAMAQDLVDLSESIKELGEVPRVMDGESAIDSEVLGAGGEGVGPEEDETLRVRDPFARLEGGGQQLDLSEGISGETHLSPSKTEPGETVISGDYSSFVVSEYGFETIFLTPYRYLWELRDVVAQYFAR